MKDIDFDKLTFDLSKVTIGEMAKALDPEHGVLDYIKMLDKVIQDIDVYEIPLNLFPVLANRFGDYLKSFMTPFDRFSDLLDEIDDS